jgi:hypothetical protein
LSSKFALRILSPLATPDANVPDSYIEPKTYKEHSQRKTSEIIEYNYSSLPKWINDIISVELNKALFLRTRHRDHPSKKFNG